jgi:protein-tyrosine phosphatase
MSEIPQHEPGRVLAEGLFIGSALSSRSRHVLTTHNISSIVNCATEIPNSFEEDGGLRYHSLPLEDDVDEDVACHVDSAVSFIRASLGEGRCVLVHCQAGISRSATVVLAFLIKDRRMSLRSAFDLVREVRPEIQPNSGFFRYLSQLEVAELGKSTFTWREYIVHVLLELGVSKEKAVHTVNVYGDHPLALILSMALE